MSLALLLVMAFAPAQPSKAAPASTATPAGVDEQEIVVTATRKGKCRIQRADQILSDREFDKSAGEWASLGTPVRVVTPTRADYKCLAKIVFRLSDRGVRLIQFVDRAAPPE